LCLSNTIALSYNNFIINFVYQDRIFGFQSKTHAHPNLHITRTNINRAWFMSTYDNSVGSTDAEHNSWKHTTIYSVGSTDAEHNSWKHTTIYNFIQELVCSHLLSFSSAGNAQKQQQSQPVQ